MVDYAARPGESRPGPRASRATSLLRNVDWMLLSAVAGIVAYGLWVVAGVTRYDVSGDENFYVVRQATFALLGSSASSRRRYRPHY